ncbi:MAG TPA: WXG100 family type VII secretion target [Chloroflexota bacterium]|nr:WXG100 family type VII secretion target [Chloroflexota bacterium]
MTQQEIKMDYPLVEEMSKVFQAGQQQLQDALKETQNIAGKLEGGALLGDAGSTFSDAIRNKLGPSIQRLSAKFEELQGDLAVAEQAMHQAEASAKSSFGG